MIQLIVFRAIQGVGGGGTLTLAMIISASRFCIVERRFADVSSLGRCVPHSISIIGSVAAVSNSLGPIFGRGRGVCSSFNWKDVFSPSVRNRLLILPLDVLFRMCHQVVCSGI